MLCKQCGYYAAHEHKGLVYELCSTCLINDVIDYFGMPDPQRSPTPRAPVQPEQKCPWCDGTGYLIIAVNGDGKCRHCNGTGHF